MQYELVSRTGQEPTLSIFGSFGAKVITTTHPYFAKVVEYLTTTPEADHDEDALAVILDPALRLGALLAEVNPRVTYDTGAIYLDGVRLHSLIEKHILERVENGDTSWDRLVRFLIKVDENPSRAAQEAVYLWLDHHGLQITEDGDFVGYKGVREDGRSVTAGPNNYVNGVIYGTPGVSTHVPHEVGSVISKKRADVDDNTALACSTGLHVGTHQYAVGFGPRLLTVKVNPADVVSVPGDGTIDWKIRVCRYEVIALNEAATQFTGYSYDEGDETPEPEVEDDLLDDNPVCEDCGDSREEDNTVRLRSSGIYCDSCAEEAEDDEDEPEDCIQCGAPGTDTTPQGAWLCDDEGCEAEYYGYSDEDEESDEDDQEDVRHANLFEAEQANDRRVLDVLTDVSMGHKPAARALSDFVDTTESSVRRWRKAHGIVLGG